MYVLGLTHSLTNSLTHSLTHSLTEPLCLYWSFLLVPCSRRSGDDQPALHFTDSEYTEVFISFCQRKQLQFAHVQMIKDYIGNMSDKHPGLVLHMLDVLDVITNYADSEAEYVARAQDIYLGRSRPQAP